MAADKYLRTDSTKKHIKIFGVASHSQEERVPGSRSPSDLREIERIGGFLYQEAIDFNLVTSVLKSEAYAMNSERIRQSLIPVGPSGGLLEAGFYNLLREKVEANRVSDLMNERNEIVVVLMWVDSYLAYLDDLHYVANLRR
jgi:cysteine synthase